MNTATTLQQLQGLRLTGMAKRYQTLLSLPTHRQEDAHTILALMCQAEQEYRRDKQTERLLKAGKLRYRADMEEIICSPERGITKETLLQLAEGHYLEKGQNLLIHGQTGTGKSFLACALGRSACLMGYKTLYLSMNKFLETIAQSRIDGTYLKLIKQLTAKKLVILDDFGLKPLSGDAKLTLLDLLEDRYGIGSVIITSQLPFDHFYAFLDQPTLAEAILDRLSAAAHKIELKGESLRKRK
jgi:DNA replication protein DnaC